MYTLANCEVIEFTKSEGKCSHFKIYFPIYNKIAVYDSYLCAY